MIESFQNGTLNFQAILISICIGLAAGTIAKLLMPGKDGTGIISTSLLGIAGSFVAGFALHHFQISVDNQMKFFGFQIIGAFAILLVWRIVKLII